MDEVSAEQPAPDASSAPTAPPTPSKVAAASPAVNDASSPAPLVPSSTVESLAPSSPYSNVSPNDDDVQPPPAKRARKHSDADQASLANVRLFYFVRHYGRADANVYLKTATPPPASLSPAPVPETSSAPNGNTAPVKRGPVTFSAAQYKFCLSIVRTLKKQKAAGPFLKPVDAVALGIPHYVTIIKNPMDLSTVELKLQSTNPSKPDPNPTNPRYYNTDEFIADVRLIFTNCLTFNGETHPVTQMGRTLEEMFDKQMKKLPPPEVVSETVFTLVQYL